MTNGDLDVLLDLDDSVVFIIFFIAVILITLGLFRVRPKSFQFWRRRANTVQPNNALERSRDE